MLPWLVEDTVFIDWFLRPLSDSIQKLDLQVSLQGVLQGFTTIYFPDGGYRGSSLLDVSFFYLQCFLLFVVSSHTDKMAQAHLPSPVVTPSLGTIILATLDGGHEGYSPGPALSQSIILQIPLSSASGYQPSSTAKQTSNRENVSTSFINPIFRNEFLWASSTPIYLK